MYCNLRPSYAGGGWTLLLKARDDGNAFNYDSPHWSSPSTLHPHSLSLRLEKEAKFDVFNKLSMREFMLVMPGPESPIVWRTGPIAETTGAVEGVVVDLYLGIGYTRAYLVCILVGMSTRPHPLIHPPIHSCTHPSTRPLIHPLTNLSFGLLPAPNGAKSLPSFPQLVRPGLDARPARKYPVGGHPGDSL